MSEQVPTFLVKGDRIVDVVFTEWEFGEWESGERKARVVKRLDHRLTEDIDRVVFELPDGCFEAQVRHTAGQLIALAGPSEPGVVPVPIDRCRTPRAFAAREEEVASRSG